GEGEAGEGQGRIARDAAEIVVADLHRQVRRELVAAEDLPGRVGVLAVADRDPGIGVAGALELRLPGRYAGVEAFRLVLREGVAARRERGAEYCALHFLLHSPSVVCGAPMLRKRAPAAIPYSREEFPARTGVINRVDNL